MSTLLEQARQAMEANEFEQAVTLYSEIIAENDVPNLYWQRATAYIGLQKFELALTDMNTYFEKKPDEANTEMYRQRVILSYNLKQYSIAKGDLEKIMALNANNPNYNPSEDYFWLGQCCFFLNDIPNAKANWEKSDDERAKQALNMINKEQGNATYTQNTVQNEQSNTYTQNTVQNEQSNTYTQNTVQNEQNTTQNNEEKSAITGLSEDDPAHQTAKRRLQAVAKTSTNNAFNRTNTFSLSTTQQPDYDAIVTAIESVSPAAYLYLDGKTPKVTQYVEKKPNNEKVYSIEFSVYGLSIFAEIATEANTFKVHNPLHFTVQALVTYEAENRVCTLIRQQLQKLGYQ